MKAKKLSEIHREAEKNLGLRPGSTTNVRNGHSGTGTRGPLSPGDFPMNQPGAGGMMMPGMPGGRKMPGMPGLDNDNWEVPRSRSMPRADPLRNRTPPFVNKLPPINSRLLPQRSGALISSKTSALVGNGGPLSRSGPVVTTSQTTGPPKSLIPDLCVDPIVEQSAAAHKSSSAGLKKKTISLLEEYFHIRILDEAQQCIEELKSPDYYQEVVKEAISLALDKGASSIDPLLRLLQHLYTKNIFKASDLETGCLLYSSLLDELAIDLPRAPAHFGEVIGCLVLSRCLSIEVVEGALKKMEDVFFRAAVFEAMMKTIKANPSGQAILSSHAATIHACSDILSSK
ncbi:hypothetical protein ABZP36_023929 [Zizania latifolia]